MDEHRLCQFLDRRDRQISNRPAGIDPLGKRLGPPLAGAFPAAGRLDADLSLEIALEFAGWKDRVDASDFQTIYH